MGAVSFAKRCQSEGTDLGRVGLTPERCVTTWRKDHPKVAGPSGVWRILDNGIETVIKERVERHLPVDGTQIHARMHKKDLHIGLPSGRHLIYPNARMAPSEKFPLRHQATYDSPMGPRQLYGGLITENIVQALAADCFRFWILEAERAGLRVIGHTHDEIIIETPTREAELIEESIKRLMRIAPPWAPSLPVDAEGDDSPHYKK